MEALHRGELARLLNAELDNWLDHRLNDRFSRLESELRVRLRTIGQRVYDKYADAIEALQQDFAEIANNLAEVESEFSDWEEEAGELWQTIAAEIEEQRPDLSDVEVPRSRASGSTDRFVLFDSRRDYFTQMDAYNAWRDGDELYEGTS